MIDNRNLKTSSFRGFFGPYRHPQEVNKKTSAFLKGIQLLQLPAG